MHKKLTLALISGMMITAACNNAEQDPSSDSTTSTNPVSTVGQSGVKDDVSAKNIVGVASGSPDHTTLVAAVKAAELVDALSNAGPFTVFAPTNAAFEKLPAGTVEDLLKPESKAALQNILQYHVYVGVLQESYLSDGQNLGQVNGSNVSISKRDGKTILNDKATIIASIPTSNGVIHVIDEVLLPED